MREPFDVAEAELKLRQDVERTLRLVFGAQPFGNFVRGLIGTVYKPNRPECEHRLDLLGCHLKSRPSSYTRTWIQHLSDGFSRAEGQALNRPVMLHHRSSSQRSMDDAVCEEARRRSLRVATDVGSSASLWRPGVPLRKRRSRTRAHGWAGRHSLTTISSRRAFSR